MFPRSWRNIRIAASDGTYLLWCVFVDFKTIISFVVLVNVSWGGGCGFLGNWRWTPALYAGDQLGPVAPRSRQSSSRRRPQKAAFSSHCLPFLCTPPLFIYFFSLEGDGFADGSVSQVHLTIDSCLCFAGGESTHKENTGGVGGGVEEKSIYGQSSHQPLISVWLHFKKHSSALKSDRPNGDWLH